VSEECTKTARVRPRWNAAFLVGRYGLEGGPSSIFKIRCRSSAGGIATQSGEAVTLSDGGRWRNRDSPQRHRRRRIPNLVRCSSRVVSRPRRRGRTPPCIQTACVRCCWFAAIESAAAAPTNTPRARLLKSNRFIFAPGKFRQTAVSAYSRVSFMAFPSEVISTVNGSNGKTFGAEKGGKLGEGKRPGCLIGGRSLRAAVIRRRLARLSKCAWRRCEPPPIRLLILSCCLVSVTVVTVASTIIMPAQVFGVMMVM
jgi:hypothetical protein